MIYIDNIFHREAFGKQVRVSLSQHGCPKCIGWSISSHFGSAAVRDNSTLLPLTDHTTPATPGKAAEETMWVERGEGRAKFGGDERLIKTAILRLKSSLRFSAQSTILHENFACWRYSWRLQWHLFPYGGVNSSIHNGATFCQWMNSICSKNTWKHFMQWKCECCNGVSD